MIDTIKLSLNDDQFLVEERFGNLTERNGVTRIVRNPTRSELRFGIYLPRVTLTSRPTRHGRERVLSVEFSAPKLLFGNNFDEATDKDFNSLVTKLRNALSYMGIETDEQFLADARVMCLHPSKNIVLDNSFGSQIVINALRKVDFNRAYSIQKTDFQDGEILHFHSNSKDIAFYDKLADLRQAKISDKKSIENDNQLQIGLLCKYGELKGISVLRYEIRINGVRAMERNFKDIPSTELTLQRLFNAELCKKILISHWEEFLKQIDYLSLDVNKPLEILQNYLIDNEHATPQAALATVAGLLVANQESVTALRNVLDKRFGRHYWLRFKPSIKTVKGRRYLEVLQVTDSLEKFEPTSIRAITKNVA